MRCFLPRYGIRAHGSEGVLFEIAFCFHCNGAPTLLPGLDEQDLIAFDADSAPAQRLLEKFKALDQPHLAAFPDNPDNNASCGRLGCR